ncbi:class D sortase [Paenibacillus dakarensis]|uniref:class D sortase n=1 Tax=Paenibacillus dakarensis TaxID=1527293 RepID=UPI0006D52E96|nr:class D sortase [Paenibacillus dakarensis]
MKIKVAALLLIVTGAVVLFYPALAEKYHDRQKEQIIREWQNSMLNINNGEGAAEGNSASEAVKTETAEDDSASDRVSNLGHPNAEGILIIDKINLMQPILHGATASNLNITLGSVENTGKAGEIGNYAVAGHRNHTYGRNFNRLDEIVVGDKVQVNNGTETFEYTVTEKLYVKPEEVEVLDPNGVDKEITLITCHPMVNPTHRIIVKGKIIDPSTASSL